MTTLDQLIPCLTEAEHVDGDTWRTGTLGLAGGHVFGGQMIGQSVSLAARVLPDLTVRSVSVVFPRGARDTGSLDYDVDTLHGGRSYGTVSISCSQPDRDGNPAVGFQAQVMCHAPAAGIEHGDPTPADAGDPDDARPAELGMIPWETRIVGDTDLNDPRAQPARLLMWTRVGERLGDDPALHQALFSFFSELTLIGTAILPHEGWSQLDAHVALRTSVLAHRLTFHRPFRMDEWLLVSQTSHAASGGSAYGTGHLFTQGGELVASFAQESMTRIAPDVPRAVDREAAT